MKKIILPILLFCATLSINAQEYMRINSHWYENYIPVEDIDSISYGELSYQKMLPAIMAKDPSISLFNQALELTHLSDSLLEEYDYSYQGERGVLFPGFQSQRLCVLPEKRKGYTAFVEPDSVYAKHGINNIEDLKAYAARVYNEMYPEDAGITDPTDRRNSLNRFVSYHILPIKAGKDNLTLAGMYDRRNNIAMIEKFVPGYNISDWHETMMPHSLMKCTTPYNKRGARFINRCGTGDLLRSDTTNIEGAEIINTNAALNGYCHYINDIIAYDKQTQTVVLDEQIIIDEAILTPEIINNNLRLNMNYSQPSGVYPNGIYLSYCTLKNFNIYSSSTQIYYLYSYGWANFQSDEMLVLGNFDFSIKLPSVPAGTYELNMGCSAYSYRPIFVCYLNEEFCDTIDARDESAGNKKWGFWRSDEELRTPEKIAQNDSLLFVNGYRKGLPNYYGAFGGGNTMRNGYMCMRPIITTFTTDGKSDYYLRFKSVDSNPRKEFHLDFLELTPTHLLKEYK
ncbi:MAG: hypothetical protein E7089_09555 [Bacteroidales bacterium]|nr:hypothetical protein [Bacteroidales bacterium]